MRLVDTHLHLIDLDRLNYPWLDNVPALKRNLRYNDYAATAHAAGVTDVLHMEVDVAPEEIADEIAMVDRLVASGATRLCGAIAACRPEAPDFPAFLERLLAEPIVRGLRRILHVVPDELSAAPLFRQNLRRLAGTGLTFDLCLRADQLGLGLALVDHCPDVAFVLDHMGGAVAGPKADPKWCADMQRIAERPNVTVKLSGIAATAKGGWSYADVHPAMAETVAIFGADRIVWGSDWPVCTLAGSFAQWIDATMRFADELTADEKAALFSLNALRVYRIA